MKFQKRLLIIGCIFCSTIVYSQQPTGNQQAIEDLIEELAKGIEGDADFSQIADDLYFLLENPININKAAESSFEKLRVLNDFQVKNLLNYIQTHGDLVTMYELQLIEGFDYATINKMLPFVTIESEIDNQDWDSKKALNYGTHTVLGRISSILEQQNGYRIVSDSMLNSNPNKSYPGNSLHVYTRYKFNYKNKLQWGITAEKDPGEQFFKEPQKQGFDFYSAHLQVNDIGMLKTAILGDYQVQFGQGLIMWSYLSTGKSSYIMDIRKRGNGIHRYTSTDENAYLRGGGFTLAKYGLEFTAFGSYKNIDANISIEDTLTDDPQFSSFLNTGIHATPAEIDDKDALQETTFGGNLNYRYNNFKIGVSGLESQYSIPFRPDESVENKFRFTGESNSNFSADAEVKFKAMHIFSEAALSENGGKAFLAGALMELTSQLRTSVLYRNYQKEYQALYSNAFAEGSRVQNEQGFYMGIEMIPVKKWKVVAYNDFYKFPWLTSSTDSPSKGNDFLIQTDFTVSRTISMYWRYKHEVKEQNTDSITNGLAKLIENKKSSFRYQIGYVPMENWEFRNRIELSSYATDKKELGYLLYQDIIYRPSQFPLSVTFRYAVFDTESYNSRIYTYESDVLNAYSVPPLYDKGTRIYIMFKYKVTEGLDFWLRFAQTWYANKSEIGTGLNQINGDTKSDVKFQLRWQF